MFVVSGRVQGVGFRAFVRRHAADLGIRGYARNLADGRVEVLAMGSEGAVEALRGLLHNGPPWSEVRTVEEQETSPVGYDEFFIR